ncbi:nucleoside triphosphate pyrophosphohydrolase [Paenibacillus sp. MBLB4367]|uniref:nucleoside triphosphate pyrophosphohydrolase n=1 Tax=Paenibacillus sp. MBLB4367 TaxID=3384767 RepID=UPI003908378C
MPGHISVVGLGTGDESQLTLGIWRKLQQASPHIYARTERHPVLGWLKENGIEYTPFDRLYESHDAFEDVYDAIADELLALAKANPEREIVYAVPGHPMVAEQTTQLLRSRCPEAGVELTVLGGESFLDQSFLRLGFDPIEGFQLLDASQLSAKLLNPQLHTVIGQVYDAYTASDAKLALMDVYPDDYPVVVGHALGVAGEERILRVPLYELDRVDGYGNLSLVWVPRSGEESLQNRSFHRLHEIVEILRSPEGCPWDREQTHASIRKNFIEETYEVLETIDDDDPDAMCEELGDVLLQIMLHAQMEQETGAFTVYDVIQGLNEKLIRRHPHVFGTLGADNADEALANWQAIKQEEKASKGVDTARISQLSGVPRDLPGLMKAWKLQKKAAEVGFDWDRIEDVYAKIEEELQELKDAAHGPGADPEEAKAELGDLLFAVVNAARFLKADPEEALAQTNKKFVARFSYIEQKLRENGKTFEQTNLTEMEYFWQEAKKVLKNSLQ